MKILSLMKHIIYKMSSVEIKDSVSNTSEYIGVNFVSLSHFTSTINNLRYLS